MTKELFGLITSNLYSIIYYSSEICHLPTLKQNLKQKVLSSSASAIKCCLKFDSTMISFERICVMNKRAVPDKYLLYKHALALYKLINTVDNSLEWSVLNFNSSISFLIASSAMANVN